MQINIVDPVLQTQIFTALLVLAIILTVRKKPSKNSFDAQLTNELKGVAILMVMFSHIGYFLATDNRFLFPLSVAAGKGVDIFLFLSGFGLTISALQSSLNIKNFYFKRLKKIFVPMWLVLAVFLLMDAVVLRRFYPTTSVAQNILGFFPSADLYNNVNSPLWYFTLILFYYLLFPLCLLDFFVRRVPVVSALIMLGLGYFATNLNLPVAPDVLKLYKLHYMAFPLGMLFATVLRYFRNHPLVLPPLPRVDALFAKLFVIIILTGVFCYLAIHSGVGESLIKEQSISLASLGCLVAVFLLKGFYSRFLTLIGAYSYELYLIHWPLMSRYDFLYTRFPAWLATALYIVILLTLGVALNKLTRQFVAIIPIWKVHRLHK